MKKKIIFAIAALLISIGISAQEQTQQQSQTQNQTQIQQQTGDPIMNKDRIRTRLNNGSGTLTRSQKREMRKQNNAITTNKTAKQSGVQQQDRDRANFQKRAKPMNARPPMNRAIPRTGTMQRKGGR